jgi:signal transduction histidine kinase
MVDVTLTFAAVVGFATLLAIAIHRHARWRQPGALALAHVLGVYVVAALGTLTQMLPAMPHAMGDPIQAVLATAFSMIPLLMLRFADEFVPVPRVVGYIAVAVWVPMALASVLFSLGAVPLTTEVVVLWLFVVLWAVGHGVAVVWLLRGSRRVAAVVARRRAQLMAAAVAGLGVVLPVGVAVGELLDADQVGTGILLLAVITIAALLLGFAPPPMLRWQWSRRDREQLEHAQRRLVEGDDPDELAAELLPHVMRQCGARGAWLLAGGDVVASVPASAPPPRLPVTREPAGTVAVKHTEDGHVLVAPTTNGHLVLSVDAFALLFGARDLDTISALAVQLDLVLDRARLKARELAAVRQTEEARRITEVERIRDDVLATVSHEMRTPLTTVCGVSSLLEQRWAQLDEDARLRMVSRIAANADDLRAAIEEILDLTAHRLAAPDEPSLRPVEVAGLLRRTVSDCNGMLADHDVLVLAPEGVVALLDVAATQQILRHLLANAAKFAPAGTPIEVEARTEGPQLCLVVSDRGPGMDAEDLERAFEPFYRGGDVLRRDTRGLGLGLAVVNALAVSVGAHLEADSARGLGTRVTVILPDAIEVGAGLAPDRGAGPAR